MNGYYNEGRAAALSGKSLSDNPYFTGEFTKLGTPKLSEQGYEWADGFGSVFRECSTKEQADAANLDVSKFRRKSNQYYLKT